MVKHARVVRGWVLALLLAVLTLLSVVAAGAPASAAPPGHGGAGQVQLADNLWCC